MGASPWSNPYDVVRDKNGEAWTGSMSNDRVARLDPKTGTTVEYLLPRYTNIRRVFVDDKTSPGDVLGRQQPRRVGDQARAAGLSGRPRQFTRGRRISPVAFYRRLSCL